MKHQFFISFLFLVAITGNSQERTAVNGTLIANGVGNSPLSGTIIDPSWKSSVGLAGDAWKGNEIIKGTIFYSDELSEGYILLEGEKLPRKALLRYNVYSHEINYLQDNQELVLNPLLPVHEFGFLYTTDDGKKKVLFRSGYPIVDNYNNKTFYEVVAGRKIALLKYISKKILEKRGNTGAFEKSVIDKESWYVYDSSTNTMAAIKKNKTSLAAALPRYAEQIKTIVSAKDLRLKDDEEWIILFDALNAL